MKASELRIGNWVEATNDDVPYPYIITAQEIVFCESDDSRFNPIQLTEEWLLKMGFEQSGWGFLNQIFILKRNASFYFEFELEGDLKEVELRYVHQLQNLYWCLCGEELEINSQ